MQMTIDRVLLNMKNSGSNMMLISVSRHRHIEDYINIIMELLRYSEKDLAIEYQPLTYMQCGDFRDKYRQKLEIKDCLFTKSYITGRNHLPFKSERRTPLLNTLGYQRRPAHLTQQVI